MNNTILWFRRDLRLYDNPALNWVLDNATSVLAVFIYAIDEERPWQPGAASRWWLHNSLVQLEKKLLEHGHKLHFFSGHSDEILAKIIQTSAADSLVFNNLYEPHLYKRDLELQQKLKHSIKVLSFDSGLFFKPGTILNQQNKPYRVYTPFYNKTRALLSKHNNLETVQMPGKSLQKLPSARLDFSQSLNSLDIPDKHTWHDKLHNYWRPGEKNALNQLDSFLHGTLHAYQPDRDIPSIDGTSRLSPCLHFGEITPQQIYTRIWPVLEGLSDPGSFASAEVFLKQLLWREFAHHILWHFPHTATQPMNPLYTTTFWRTDPKDFNLWCSAQTGVPIVDAGMKQLRESGWMHNRVRLIASSFLTKNLGINWTLGSKWFWDTLVDANLANNSLAWQWVAGCGVDAAPYYRIFNPLTQTKRFDPSHDYVNHWLSGSMQTEYPQPVVDLDSSRNLALQRYKDFIRTRSNKRNKI